MHLKMHTLHRARHSSLFSRLMGTYVLVTVLGLIALSFFFYIFFSRYYFGIKEQQLLEQGQEMAQILSPYMKNKEYGQVDAQINIFNKVNVQRMWVVDKEGNLVGGTADSTHAKGEFCPENDQLKKALQGETAIREGKISHMEEPVLSIAMPIYVNEKVDGAIFVCNPLAEISNSITQTLKIVIFAGVIGIIIVGFVSFFLSRSITRPIKEITVLAEEMAHGKFNQAKVSDVECDREAGCDDEVGQLAKTFNYMAATLDKTLHDLEEEKNKTEQMEKLQREFVANASHELRTPLTSMRGFLEGILDGVVQGKEQERKYISIVHKETVRLHKLVNSLLDLSRIESGQTKIDIKALDIRQVVEKTVTKLKPLIEDHQLNLVIEVPPGLPMAWGDEDLVDQVLINYITNAIRFTAEGGQITVKAEYIANEVRVHIADTGVGIPPEELPNVWKRFYKVNEARPLSKGGSGLGLALVKEIVEQLGGRVWATSVVDQGSIFSFSLKPF